MKLIACLGNPGRKYEFTRHNIGFLIADHLAEKNKIQFKEGRGLWLEANSSYNDEEFYIIKPLTYMNNSGAAVKDFSLRKEIVLKDILIVVDDFQIPLGTIRVRERGSDGGHNGLASIIYHLGTEEYARMRAGIGVDPQLEKEEYIDFVLGKFSPEEMKIINNLMPVYTDCIYSFLSEGIRKTMNDFNKSFISN